MKSPKLFVSFWHVCLENFPEGTFIHRRMKPADARRAISAARKRKSLLCVSQDDLLAPYRQRERKNHFDLCRVLTNEFGIELTVANFCGNFDDEDDSMVSINPLNIVQVSGRDRLIIANCAYTLDKRKRKDRLTFKVEPSTVGFHLIETV
jgi:hypothetical protein